MGMKICEMNRYCTSTTDRKPEWPNFLQEVLLRKRNWRQGAMEVTVDKVEVPDTISGRSWTLDCQRRRESKNKQVRHVEVH